MEGGADIINSTLGKALGGVSTTENLISHLCCVQAAGGYTTGSSSLVSLLRQRSRPYRCTLLYTLYRVNTHRALLQLLELAAPAGGGRRQPGLQPPDG